MTVRSLTALDACDLIYINICSGNCAQTFCWSGSNNDRDCVMPWSEYRYPSSMKNLPPVVRSKAIDIANALLEEGYEEGRAIRIAISRAKRWGVTHAGVVPDWPSRPR